MWPKMITLTSSLCTFHPALKNIEKLEIDRFNPQLSQVTIFNSIGYNYNPDSCPVDARNLSWSGGRRLDESVTSAKTNPSFTLARKIIASAFSADAGSMATVNICLHTYVIHKYLYSGWD